MHNNTRTIPVGQYRKAIVDVEDYERLSQYRWLMVGVYARRCIYDSGKKTYVYMHREILEVPRGMVTDHINGDGLDNRRSNLRIATLSQNAYNQGVSIKNKTGYKGVSWSKHAKQFTAHIRANGKQKCLGYFRTSLEAYHAYCNAAAMLHGEFANLG